MSPSKILTTYYIITFVTGALFTLPVAHWVSVKEVGMRGALGLILCWNVLFVMLLPLILDWLERKYLKARFIALEDLAKTNPELASALTQQCEKRAIPGLKLAVIDTNSSDLFSYGLLGSNARLMIPGSLLEKEIDEEVIPSIELELSRFTRRNHTVVYLIFAGFQAVILSLVLAAFFG